MEGRAKIVLYGVVEDMGRNSVCQVTASREENNFFARFFSLASNPYYPNLDLIPQLVVPNYPILSGIRLVGKFHWPCIA